MGTAAQCTCSVHRTHNSNRYLVPVRGSNGEKPQSVIRTSRVKWKIWRQIATCSAVCMGHCCCACAVRAPCIFPESVKQTAHQDQPLNQGFGPAQCSISQKNRRKMEQCIEGSAPLLGV